MPSLFGRTRFAAAEKRRVFRSKAAVKLKMWILKPRVSMANKWRSHSVSRRAAGSVGRTVELSLVSEVWAAQGMCRVLPHPRGSTGFGQKNSVDEIPATWGAASVTATCAGAIYVEKIALRRIRTGSERPADVVRRLHVDWCAGQHRPIQMPHLALLGLQIRSMWGTTEELWFDEYEHGGLPWRFPANPRLLPAHQSREPRKVQDSAVLIQNDSGFPLPGRPGPRNCFGASPFATAGVEMKLINFLDEGHWVLKPVNSKFWHEQVFGWQRHGGHHGGGK